MLDSIPSTRSFPPRRLRRRLGRSPFFVATLAFGGMLALGITAVRAHEIRPGYLELRSLADGRYAVLWKVPTRGNLRMALEPVFPSGCEATTPISSYVVPGAIVERWTISCADGLLGRPISVDGLEATLTDVLLRVELESGETRTARLRPSVPFHVLEEALVRTDVAVTYLRLGFEHILGGFDHLLFVLALLLIVRGRRRLLVTITSFTLAHSITLSVAVLGFVDVAQAPVEATIALSILLLASEIMGSRSSEGAKEASLVRRYPWIVAFVFGLLHGFGFAGALSEVGLPAAAIPVALLFFNIGVEVGQISFVVLVLALMAVVERLDLSWPRSAWRVLTYAIGSLAAFWTVQRIVGFWG